MATKLRGAGCKMTASQIVGLTFNAKTVLSYHAFTRGQWAH